LVHHASVKPLTNADSYLQIVTFTTIHTLQVTAADSKNFWLHLYVLVNWLQPAIIWTLSNTSVLDGSCSGGSGKVLLAFTSTVILHSAFHATHDHILSHNSGSHATTIHFSFGFGQLLLAFACSHSWFQAP
jgi:hypothetical protein